MSDALVIGLRGDIPFEEAESYFRSKGCRAVIVDPSCVCGRDHALSAVLHAERAFRENRNRSKELSSEIILYLLCERQISKAFERARPVGDCMVAIIPDPQGISLDDIPMERDDSLFGATREKAAMLGADMSCGIGPEDAAMEAVAFVDLMKQRSQSAECQQ